MADLSAIPEPVVTHTAADLQVRVTPRVDWPQEIVPARTVTYSVEPYYVVDGQAVADSELATLVDVVIGLGDLADVVGFPLPDDVETGADARWVATDASYADDGTWTTSGGTEGLSWVAPNEVPAFLPSAQYWRGDTYIDTTAVSLDAGEHLRLDAPGWGAARVTMLVVAILRAPLGTWYSVLEANDLPPADDGADGGDSTTLDFFDPSYLSVRYAGNGELSLVSSATLARTQIEAGLTRPLQPVIVGFSANMLTGSAALLATDSRPHIVPVTLPVQQPLTASLYLGKAASVFGGRAAMEVFEIDLWEGEADTPTLLERMAVLDRAYGVSA